jgi:hypothetical protein
MGATAAGAEAEAAAVMAPAPAPAPATDLVVHGRKPIGGPYNLFVRLLVLPASGTARAAMQRQTASDETAAVVARRGFGWWRLVGVVADVVRDVVEVVVVVVVMLVMLVVVFFFVVVVAAVLVMVAAFLCERRIARWRLWLATRVLGTAVARQNCRSRAIGMTWGEEDEGGLLRVVY